MPRQTEINVQTWIDFHLNHHFLVFILAFRLGDKKRLHLCSRRRRRRWGKKRQRRIWTFYVCIHVGKAEGTSILPDFEFVAFLCFVLDAKETKKSSWNVTSENSRVTKMFPFLCDVRLFAIDSWIKRANQSKYLRLWLLFNPLIFSCFCEFSFDTSLYVYCRHNVPWYSPLCSEQMSCLI